MRPAKVIWTKIVNIRDFGRDSQLDTSRRQHDRRKMEHAIGLLRKSRLADPGADAGPAGNRWWTMGVGPPAMNFALLPRDRRDK